MSSTTLRRRGSPGRRVLLLAALVVLAIAVAALVAACGGGDEGSTEESPAANTKPLLMSYDADVATWDPSVSASTESQWLSNVYEPLIWANPPGSDDPFKPALATSWEVSDDGLTWTFHLREGVTFHDGTPFTADAVKYSIERTKAGGKGYAYIWTAVEEIKVVDDLTVEFVTKTPTTVDRLVAAGYGAWIFSPATEGKDEAWFNEGPASAGTGPYKVVSYKPNEEIRFAAFKDYWGGWKPEEFKDVIFRFAKEATSTQQMLEGGELDVAPNITQDVAAELEGSESVKVARAQSFQTWQVALNCGRKPLNDVRVRQALSYATPYADIIDVSQRGMAAQAKGPLPQGLWPASDTVPQYTYDLEKAKALLADAGYPNGFKLLFTVLADYGNEKVSAELIKESYAKIGVDVEIREMLWNQMWDLAKSGPGGKAQDMYFCVQWPSYPDGYDILMIGYYTQDPAYTNVAYYSNKEVDAMIDEAHNLSVTDPDKAQEIYAQVQDQIVEDAPYLFLYDSEALAAYNPAIQGVTLNPNYPTVLFWHDMHL
jgi:peptide/nickel transport system substrate-binding protein